MRHPAFTFSTLLALLIAITAWLCPSPARAQAEDRALALDLFEQGRALEARGDYAGALTKFEGAARVMRTFGILLNTAECQEKLGRTASAWATWREARAVAVETHRADDEALAVERGRALEPKISRLLINVPPSADLPDLEISRDGVAVPRGAWGNGIPVDPGPHVIVERASGHRAATLHVTVDPSAATATVTMNVLDVEAVAPPPVALAAPVPTVGRLAINTSESTDLVSLDDQTVATGAWHGNVTPGTHHVKVTGAGKKPYTTDVQIAAGEHRSIDVALESERKKAIWPWIVGGAGVAVAGAIIAGLAVSKSGGSPSAPPPGIGATTVQLQSFGRWGVR